MEKKEILNIFYNNIIKEATTGKVDCYLKYNLIFNTEINGIKLKDEVNILNDDLLIPTLFIRNKEEFDLLLLEYVDKALKFYDDSNFEEEVLNGEVENREIGISKEKVIMSLLWSNATVEDFNDPCAFLRKRISFFDLVGLEEYTKSKIIGYSEILDVDIECIIEKNRLTDETPYSLQLFLKDNELGEKLYSFPKIYFGLDSDKAYIYAMKNDKRNIVDFENFKDDKLKNKCKKLKRKMYMVNSGLDVNNEGNDVANLKDITHSFLLAANIMVGMLKKYNINKLDVVSILICRWNASILVSDYKKNKLEKLGVNKEEIKALKDKVFVIQSNLTDKLLRTFRRIGYHHSSIGVIGYPMEEDSSLNIILFDQEDICSNDLLAETYQINPSKVLKK